MQQAESSRYTIQRRKNSCLRDAFEFFLWHTSRRQPITVIGGRHRSRADNLQPGTVEAGHVTPCTQEQVCDGMAWICELLLGYHQCCDTVGWASGRASGLKKWVLTCWCGYLSGVGANDFTWSTATANPVIYCLIKIQIGLNFLVPAYPHYPGKEAIKQVSVCLLGYQHAHCKIKILGRSEGITMLVGWLGFNGTFNTE